MNQVKVNMEGFELRGSIYMQISTKGNSNLGGVIWGLSQLAWLYCSFRFPYSNV